MAEWSKALTRPASCLSQLRACPDGRVVLGVDTTCSLFFTAEGLSWWPCCLRCWHWLLAVSHSWGPVLMAMLSKVLALTASCLSLLRPSLMAGWSKALTLFARCLSVLRPGLMVEWSKAFHVVSFKLPWVTPYPTQLLVESTHGGGGQTRYTPL